MRQRSLCKFVWRVPELHQRGNASDVESEPRRVAVDEAGYRFRLELDDRGVQEGFCGDLVKVSFEV